MLLNILYLLQVLNNIYFTEIGVDAGADASTGAGAGADVGVDLKGLIKKYNNINKHININHLYFFNLYFLLLTISSDSPKKLSIFLSNLFKSKVIFSDLNVSLSLFLQGQDKLFFFVNFFPGI